MKLKNGSKIEFEMIKLEVDHLHRLFDEIQEEIDKYPYDNSISLQQIKNYVKTQTILHKQSRELIDKMNTLFES